MFNGETNDESGAQRASQAVARAKASKKPAVREVKATRMPSAGQIQPVGGEFQYRPEFRDF
jgi:hypothetical protein